MYYAKFNSFGSATSIGLASAWNVAGFDSKTARDAWVNDINAARLDVVAITRKEAEKLAGTYKRRRAARGGHLADIIFLTSDNKTFSRAF